MHHPGRARDSATVAAEAARQHASVRGNTAATASLCEGVLDACSRSGRGAVNAPFALTSEGAEEAPRSNVGEFTVSELARRLKREVEDSFGQVRVRGEIGNFRGRHGSGHAYFALKDADACLDAVVWRSTFAKLAIKPDEGLEVVATGRMTTYPKKSNYQLVVEQLAPAGVGALMKLLEERRKKLAAEGLFDEARKRPLPYLPRVIGVVTSPTGAVIRDILHRFADRCGVHVVVWPVRVQGETSGPEVAAAVEGFGGDYGGPRPDVIIVARGGGSVEDLWGYNDEAVVRAVVASPIPVVSAVGHETDWSLIDHAADVRAPTPTGAAEMVVPVRAECLSRLAGTWQRFDHGMDGVLRARRELLRHLVRALPAAYSLLEGPRQRVDVAADKLVGSLAISTATARSRYATLAGLVGPQIAARSIERASQRSAHAASRLARAMRQRLADAQGVRLAATARLRADLLTRRFASEATTLARQTSRLDGAMARRLADAGRQLVAAEKLLSAVSYQAVLARGFALVRREDDTPVRSAAEVGRGATLDLEFADGRVRVVETSSARKVARAVLRSTRRSKHADDTQGVLF